MHKDNLVISNHGSVTHPVYVVVDTQEHTTDTQYHTKKEAAQARLSVCRNRYAHGKPLEGKKA